ncbi:AsnC family transcriptional regulator [Nonomuraea coxensis]|nr:AsnC family transcriptional regulator [Nonomuraea coxensis]
MQDGVELDEPDRAMAAALQLHGRAPWSLVARLVGASESTAERRVESLVRRGCPRFRTLTEPEVR